MGSYTFLFLLQGSLHFVWVIRQSLWLCLSSHNSCSSVCSHILHFFCVMFFLTCCFDLDLGLHLVCFPSALMLRTFVRILSHTFLKCVHSVVFCYLLICLPTFKCLYLFILLCYLFILLYYITYILIFVLFFIISCGFIHKLKYLFF
jgi:hypothetical protein